MAQIIVNEWFYNTTPGGCNLFNLQNANSFNLQIEPTATGSITIVADSGAGAIYYTIALVAYTTKTVQLDLPAGVYSFCGSTHSGIVLPLAYTGIKILTPTAYDGEYCSTQLLRYAYCELDILPLTIYLDGEMVITEDIVNCVPGIPSFTMPSDQAGVKATITDDALILTVDNIGCVDRSGIHAVLTEEPLILQLGSFTVKVLPDYVKNVVNKTEALLKEQELLGDYDYGTEVDSKIIPTSLYNFVYNKEKPVSKQKDIVELLFLDGDNAGTKGGLYHRELNMLLDYHLDHTMNLEQIGKAPHRKWILPTTDTVILEEISESVGALLLV